MLVLRILSFHKWVVERAALLLRVTFAFLEHRVGLSPDLGLVERAACCRFWGCISGFLLVGSVAISVHERVDLARQGGLALS